MPGDEKAFLLFHILLQIGEIERPLLSCILLLSDHSCITYAQPARLANLLLSHVLVLWVIVIITDVHQRDSNTCCCLMFWCCV